MGSHKREVAFFLCPDLPNHARRNVTARAGLMNLMSGCRIIIHDLTSTGGQRLNTIGKMYLSSPMVNANLFDK